MTARPSFLAALGAAAFLLSACSGEGAAPSGTDAGTETGTETGSEAADSPATPAATGPEAAAAQAPSPGDVIADYLPWDPDGDEVQTTESGLQYIVLSRGPEGAPSPTDRDRVTVRYEGRVARSGTTFDSAYERGQSATFPVSGVIRGWVEGLQLMSEGDSFLFYIPNDLAYGNQSRGPVIQAGDDLVFRVDLEKVLPAPEPREVSTEAWDTYTPWDSSREGIQTTESGLEYVVIAEGDSDKASPSGTDRVVVFYEGRLDATGEVFDSAYRRGQAAMFPANGLIPGWVEALQMMKPGDRWLLHIPAELAYGAQGTPGGEIPPDSDLNFEVELMDVLKVQ